jgi:hypothetical protein
LTPEDIAEVIVFAAGRRENVVIADTLVYPSHQVRHPYALMDCDADFIGWCWRYAQEVDLRDGC